MADHPLPGDGPPPAPVPPVYTTGLLDRITATSLDEDYAVVSQRRRAEGEHATRADRPGRGRRAPTVVAMVAFGALLATAAVQTARTEPVRQESQESLRAQAEDRRAELTAARREIVTLRRAVERAQDATLETSRAGRALQQRLTRLATSAGTAAVTGPGLRIVTDDAAGSEGTTGGDVLDTDLQKLVNGLWLSGAEAVAINGQRLTNLSSIRIAGEAITVNLRSLSRPYVVTALGDPEQLAARFVESDGGSWWLNLKSVYRLRFDITSEESLTVPAAPPLELQHARPAGTGR